MNRRNKYEEIVSKLARLSNLDLSSHEVSVYSKEFPKLLDWMNQILEKNIEIDDEFHKKTNEGEEDIEIKSLPRGVVLKLANNSKDGYVSASRPKGRKT